MSTSITISTIFYMKKKASKLLAPVLLNVLGFKLWPKKTDLKHNLGHFCLTESVRKNTFINIYKRTLASTALTVWPRYKHFQCKTNWSNSLRKVNKDSLPSAKSVQTLYCEQLAHSHTPRSWVRSNILLLPCTPLKVTWPEHVQLWTD